MPNWSKALDWLKQLQAILPAGLPYPTAKWFPFLNPQIGDDLWMLTSLLAFIASAINYTLAQFRQKPTLAWRLCWGGLCVAGAALVAMLMLVENLILSNHPSEQYLAVEFSFVLFFVGLGLGAGWWAGRMLRRDNAA